MFTSCFLLLWWPQEQDEVHLRDADDVLTRSHVLRDGGHPLHGRCVCGLCALGPHDRALVGSFCRVHGAVLWVLCVWCPKKAFYSCFVSRGDREGGCGPHTGTTSQIHPWRWPGAFSSPSSSRSGTRFGAKVQPWPRPQDGTTQAALGPPVRALPVVLCVQFTPMRQDIPKQCRSAAHFEPLATVSSPSTWHADTHRQSWPATHDRRTP